MKKIIILFILLIPVSATFSFSVMYVSWYDNELTKYRERFEENVGKTATSTDYRVYIASSVSEFVELSGLPYWVLAGVRNNEIFLQPLSLHESIITTLAHELTHLALQQYELDYWIEEGLACIVARNWEGKTLQPLNDIEDINPKELDYYLYQNYSYTCWIKVSKLLENGSLLDLLELERTKR
ncbi:MAG: hypothetical protein FXF54_06595 [Kosmotoga sp.]|nr:MAG: hypothetical protein FXF54_06595 [Kosmotoga sp.]